MEREMNRRSLLQSTALSILAAGLAPPLSRSTANEPADTRKNPMSNANESVVRYLAAWNEPDAARRRELVAKAWAEDGTYIDGARDGRGHDEISAMIGKAQDHFPGYRLHIASGIETHHDYVRFSWAAGGTAEAPLYIKGTDFAVLAGDGRLKSVVGFVDAAPAPAPRS
jgi:hypothetical protein